MYFKNVEIHHSNDKLVLLKQLLVDLLNSISRHFNIKPSSNYVRVSDLWHDTSEP